MTHRNDSVTVTPVNRFTGVRAPSIIVNVLGVPDNARYRYAMDEARKRSRLFDFNDWKFI